MKATEKKMDAGWFDGFEANPPVTWPRIGIEDTVKKPADFFGDLKDGDVMEIDLVPGTGSSVGVNGETEGGIEGGDFATAGSQVWLGDHPPSGDLKAGRLGREGREKTRPIARICFSAMS